MNRARLWVVWVCCFVGVPNSAWGQVNIERLRGDHWEPGFAATLRTDFSYRAGNVEIWEFGFGAHARYTWSRAQSFAVGNGDLGWKDGTRFSNAGLLHWRTIFRFRDRVYAEGFMQINYDKARRLNFRGLAGGGVRLGAVDTDAVKIWWGTTYMLERERLGLAPGDVHPARVLNHRWSNYLSLSAQANDRLGLTGAVYIQPRFGAMGDFRILGDLTLGASVSQRVDLISTLNARYDSEPPLGVEKSDVKITTGVSVRF